MTPVDDRISVDDRSSSIEILVEEHLGRLREKLGPQYSLTELVDEVQSLNDLLLSYKLRDELLEQILDIETPERRRAQIRESLEAQRIIQTYEANQAACKRLHEKSHDLIQLSIDLLSEAQRQIDEHSRKYSGYAVEVCCFCKGFGSTSANPCPACNGNYLVLVHQPALKCPKCNGTGQPERSHGLQVCIVCRGFGFVMTTDRQE